jgi:hypothetical protein
MSKDHWEKALEIKHIIELGYQGIYSTDMFICIKKMCSDVGIKEISVSPIWKYSWYKNISIGWNLIIGDHKFQYYNGQFDEQKERAAQKRLMIGDKL